MSSSGRRAVGGLRLGCRALALALCAGVLAGCRRPPPPAAPAVFVDVRQLAALHPAWPEVRGMTRVAGALPSLPASPSPVAIPEPEAPRQTPEAPIAVLPDLERPAEIARQQARLHLRGERVLAVLPAEEAFGEELDRMRTALRQTEPADREASYQRLLERVRPVMEELGRLRLNLLSLRPIPERDRFFFTEPQLARRREAYRQITMEIAHLEDVVMPALFAEAAPQRAPAPTLDPQEIRAAQRRRDERIAAALQELEARIERIAASVAPAPLPPDDDAPPPVAPGDDAPRQQLIARQAAAGEAAEATRQEGERVLRSRRVALGRSREGLDEHVADELRALVTRLGRQRDEPVRAVFAQPQQGARLPDATASFAVEVRSYYARRPAQRED